MLAGITFGVSPGGGAPARATAAFAPAACPFEGPAVAFVFARADGAAGGSASAAAPHAFPPPSAAERPAGAGSDGASCTLDKGVACWMAAALGDTMAV